MDKKAFGNQQKSTFQPTKRKAHRNRDKAVKKL